MKTTIDGLQMQVAVAGEGEPILFVHGFPLSSAMWEPTLERLGAGWRAIAPDLRGHGASDAGEEASMPRLGRDLVELLDALGEERPAVIVALSMGGYVALEMARRHPERVRALVLVDTRAEADTAEAAASRRELAERVLAEGSGVVADSMVGKLFAPEARPALLEAWRARMAATPPAGVAAALRGMAERGDSFDTLRGWKKPLLVVVGAEDAITPPDAARRMHAAADGSRLEVVPGAGHLTPVEQPDRFAALLEGFLGSLPRLH